MTEGSTRIIERAYVKMSHRPPGIKWFEKARGGGNFTIEMEIRNTGNTPATITDVVVRPFVTIPGEPFPDTPPVRRTRLERAFNAFLVKNDFFYSTPELMWVDNEVEIEKGEAVLYLFVHVDYIDQFGVRHRAGYLRRYEPRLDKLPKRRGNLVFVAEAKFNFDRLRKPGEGNDWDEKPPA